MFDTVASLHQVLHPLVETILRRRSAHNCGKVPGKIGDERCVKEVACKNPCHRALTKNLDVAFGVMPKTE